MSLFPDLQNHVSIHAQIAEIKREIGMREHVYGKRITEGTMKPEDASRYMARIKAVLETLEANKAAGMAGRFPPATEHHGPTEISREGGDACQKS